MNPVSIGTESLVIKKPDNREYESLRRSQLAQVGPQGNPYMFGIQEGKQLGIQHVAQAGFGEMVKSGMDPLGITTTPVNEIIGGRNSNFSQSGDAANAPLANPANTTGTLELGVSSTIDPHTDPSQLGMNDRFMEKMALYRTASSNAGSNLNGLTRGI